MGEVVQFPRPENLDDSQREYWLEQAAYWCIKEEDAQRALEYAHNRRVYALGMLGMLSEGWQDI